MIMYSYNTEQREPPSFRRGVAGYACHPPQYDAMHRNAVSKIQVE